MELTTHTSPTASMIDNLLSGTLLISSMKWDPWMITIHLSRLRTRKIESGYFENRLILKLQGRHHNTQLTWSHPR